MAGKLNEIANAIRSTPYPKEAKRIEKAVSTVLRQGARLQGLFVLALPGVMGVFGVYGVYDSLRMHDYHNAWVVSVLTVIFWCPLVLVILAEINQRKFIRWLEANLDTLAAGEAIFRGVKVSAHTEVVTFDLAFSVVVASFRIPSQMFIVGQHRLWLWRPLYSLGSFIFGWWGIPYGPIYTVQSLHSNLKSANRGRLLDMIDIPAWDAGGGSFGAILPRK